MSARILALIMTTASGRFLVLRLNPLTFLKREKVILDWSRCDTWMGQAPIWLCCARRKMLPELLECRSCLSRYQSRPVEMATQRQGQRFRPSPGAGVGDWILDSSPGIARHPSNVSIVPFAKTGRLAFPRCLSLSRPEPLAQWQNWYPCR